MSDINIPSEMDAALEHHRAGRLDAAETIYRRVLQQQPNNADALHLLGIIGQQLGHHQAAVELFERAILIEQSAPEFHYNLGESLRALGRLEQAETSYRHAIELRRNYALAHCGLGTALCMQRRYADGARELAEAVRIDPNLAIAHNNLGNALRALGRLDEAVGSFVRATALNPALIAARVNLGGALVWTARPADALPHLYEALRLEPNQPHARNNLGTALMMLGRFDEALREFQLALQTNPRDATARTNLGHLLIRQERLDDAIAELRKAIEFEPGAMAHNNLGNAYRSNGELDLAIEEFTRAIELEPGFSDAHSNLVYTLNFHPDYSREAIFREHLRWSQQHAGAIAPDSSHANDRTPDRRLRIGYVSPNFKQHAVNFFVEPILAAHDRENFEVICYSDTIGEDDATARLRGYASAWRNIRGIADERVAQIVRDDKIDILVDLTGHLADNRLLVFARKPAPVQITYIGYQNTTGLKTIDYRLTDEISDPSGMTDALYTEKLLRLPEIFFCYRPPDEAPPVSPRPDGPMIFGSFNHFAKVNSKLLSTWSQILHEISASRLMLLAPISDRRRGEMISLLAVDPQRIEFVRRSPRRAYLEFYHRIDIAFDTFPFNGHTTTCDALWMGVPVIHRAGETYASRFGGSALVNLGLGDLIADNSSAYLELAKNLARDRERLRELRATLRDRMRDSLITDNRRFTRNLEQIYRDVWRNYSLSRYAGRGSG